MSKSDEIATLIPFYRQFIATQRTQVQREAAKLKRRQARAGDTAANNEQPPAPRAAGAADETLPAAEEEMPIEELPTSE